MQKFLILFVLIYVWCTAQSQQLHELHGRVNADSLNYGIAMPVGIGDTVRAVKATADAAVPKSTTVAGHALSSNVTIAGSDIVVGSVGSELIKYLSGDTTTTGQSLVDIGGLSFPIQANEVWQFEFHLGTNSSEATNGIQLGIDIPASATIQATGFGVNTSATTIANFRITADQTAAAAIQKFATAEHAQIFGIVVNSTNAGNVYLSFLKASSGTATIYAKSYLIARRLL